MDRDLDQLMALAAERPVAPSQALMDRVLADAEGLAAARRAAAAAALADRRNARPAGAFGRFLAGIGGWPAVLGLTVTTAAGLWLGYAQPGQFGTLAADVMSLSTGYDLEDMMPNYDSFQAEG